MNMTINVSKPYLPPLSQYSEYLVGIWNRSWITNNGPLVNLLEKQLSDYLGVRYVKFVSSGTVALQIAIKSLEMEGEVITTAFSHVSTANSLLWGNLDPVFADILEDSFCIDPSKIEAAITNRTCAILATHVYGHPCEIKEIEKIATKYNLRVIYDGAHAFGVQVYNQSIFNYGNVTTVSFHATKLYHTIEGGAVITNDEKIANKCGLLKNFGLQAAIPHLAGLNGKNSELHAAMGLCNLPMVEDFIRKNGEISALYRSLLTHLPLIFPQISAEVKYNNTYFPIVFSSTEEMIRVKNGLENEGIYARRYFYPSLNKLSYYKKYDCPISEKISERILCLPLYYDLSLEEVRTIAQVVITIMNNK